MKFRCRKCDQEKYPKEAKVGSLTISGDVGVCKACQSAYSTRHKRMKLAEVTPNKFMRCDDCSDVFYMIEHQRGRQPLNRKPVLREACPTCTGRSIRGY